MPREIVIGTRGSALALWQAEAAKSALQESAPGMDIRIQAITTQGDRNLGRPLSELGDKGIFTKELEAALLKGEVDICVHSMKDMPGMLPQGLSLEAVLPREDPRDVLVYGDGASEKIKLDELPDGSRIGTSSLRRAAELKANYPGLVPCDIRGNVETRVQKALGPEYDGAILAAAGINRLGMAGVISSFADPSVMVPAPGQGAIGIEIRSDDCEMQRLCSSINDRDTWLCVSAERAIADALQGGCTAPLGVYVRKADSSWLLDAAAFSQDGEKRCAVALESENCTETELDRLIEHAIGQLVANGAESILHGSGARS